MSNSHTILYFIFIVTLSSSIATAQTCCSGGVPLANNIGGLPVGTGRTFQISLTTDLNVLKTLKEGARTLDDHSRQRNTITVLTKTSYSFTDHFFVEGLLSWVEQERSISQVGGFKDFKQTQGIGDWVLLANNKYVSQAGWEFIVGAGPKFPTGKSNLKDESGLTLNADLQPGSGAWDGIFVHRIIKTDLNKRTRAYFLNFIYRHTGTNDNYLNGQTYQFGNEWQLLTGISDQLVLKSSLVSYGVNLRFRKAESDRFNEGLIPNTGGNFLYIMPVLSWHLRPNLILLLNAELPLYTKVVGTQLAPSFRIHGGVYYSISGRKRKMASNIEGL